MNSALSSVPSVVAFYKLKFAVLFGKFTRAM